MIPPPLLPLASFPGRAGRGLSGRTLRIGTLATLLVFVGVALAADASGRRNVQFQPGQPWLDAQGTHLNAHGFCLLDYGGRHYWYGAHKIAGRTEAEKNEAGVRCYVSDDRLNWQDAGLVLSIFAPGAHPDLADASILDRPKVIYHDAGITPATEAPALFRHGSRIYFLGFGSSGWAPNAARLFVADQVTDPYQELGNPCRGVNPHNGLGPEKTFGGQSTFVYRVAGRRDAWIAMFDLNQPHDPITSGYIWLPIDFEGGRPVIRWRNAWDLSVFAPE